MISELPPRILEYFIITAYDPKSLEESINKKLNEGYEMLSPLKIIGEDPEDLLFVQEMTKVDRKFHFAPNDVNQRDWEKVT